MLILRVACRIGRPFTELDIPPPFAEVALNRFMPPMGAVPTPVAAPPLKLNAPEPLPPGVAVGAAMVEPPPKENGDDGLTMPIDGGPADPLLLPKLNGDAAD